MLKQTGKAGGIKWAKTKICPKFYLLAALLPVRHGLMPTLSAPDFSFKFFIPQNKTEIFQGDYTHFFNGAQKGLTKERNRETR